MSAVTSASLCWTLLSVCLLLVSADTITITAESGQSVTLPCRAPNNPPIDTVTWSTPEMTGENVLKYRNKQLLPSYQNPSFKNRVELQDGEMKDGDVSLILKELKEEDTGTYECRVIQKGAHQEELISTVSLTVVAPPPGEEGLSTGAKIGLAAAAVGVLGLLIGAGIANIS